MDNKKIKEARELLESMKFDKTVMRNFEIRNGCNLCWQNKRKRKQVLALLSDKPENINTYCEKCGNIFVSSKTNTGRLCPNCQDKE